MGNGNTAKANLQFLEDYFNNRLEGLGNTFVILNCETREIHRGYGFIATYTIPLLAFAEKVIFRYTTPLVQFPHVKGFKMSAQGATVKGTIIENASVDTAGTPRQDLIHKLNNNTQYETNSKLYLGATYTGGQEHDHIIVHGSQGASGKSATSEAFTPSQGFKYVFENNNTEYFYEIENIDTAENSAEHITTRFYFFELAKGAEDGY